MSNEIQSAPSPPSKSSRFMLNWSTLAGWVVTFAGLFAFLLLLSLDFFVSKKSPYLGILTYLVSPLIITGGLLLVLLGWILYRHKRALASAGAFPFLPAIDLSRPRDVRLLSVFALFALVLFLFVSMGSYEAYHVTKSVQFCGQTCHQEMAPQYVAYQHSPHARVECTACHIGSDAVSFVKAKFNGLGQVYTTLAGNVAKPIEGHGKIQINQKTCEQCHWPERFVGNLQRSYMHYLDDETNSFYGVKLLLKVGGGDPTHGPLSGIHWHMNLKNKVEYIASDPLKQKVPWVRLTETNGVVTEFALADFKENPSRSTIHTMDCMDCHNRPAHHFRTPNDAVDLAISLGKLSTNLPAIKRNSVLALTGSYATTEEALTRIEGSLRAAYPSRPELQSTIREVQSIYQTCLFPEMRTDWRTHANNIGHKDWPGCFRCHDNKHVSADGKRTINGQDCNSCHLILSEGSGAAFEQSDLSGREFKHPEEGWKDLRCHDCHNGSMEK